MLTIRKRLIHKKGYWASGLAVMICISIVTSLNMQTTIRPDRLSAIIHHSVSTKTDDQQQAPVTANETKTAITTQKSQNQTSSNNTTTTPQQTAVDATPVPSDTPTPSPSPDPTPTPDPTPVPSDQPVTP